MDHKEKFRKLSHQELRDLNEHEAETALAVYFTVGGNGPEAKQANNLIGSRARDRQSTNNLVTREQKDEQFKYKIAEKLDLLSKANVKKYYEDLVTESIKK